MNKSSDGNQSNDSDQRYIPRWQVTNRVNYKFDEDSSVHEGQTMDMSCTGACITIDQDILPNKKLKLSIFLSDKTRIDLEGHVIWVKTEDDQKKIGIRFDDVSTESADSILDHAFEVNPKKCEQSLV